MPTWWNKYYFTWRCLLRREILMFIVLSDKSSWEICLPEEKEFFIFIVAYVWWCWEMSRTHRSNKQDLFHQNGLKNFHQNIRGLFHNIAKSSTFLHIHKKTAHIFSLSETHIHNSARTQLFEIPGYNLH